jgi:hypothetical protein
MCAYIIEVKSEGKTATWELYMGSPNLQMMNGWKIDTYKRGEGGRLSS